MEVKPGTRLKSAVCETQVIVVKAPAGDVDLTCGGSPMLLLEAEVAGSAAPDPAHAAQTLLGKRYASEALGLELLCTKGGAGSLAVAGQPLGLKEAKPLPSSD